MTFELWFYITLSLSIGFCLGNIFQIKIQEIKRSKKE